MKTSGTGLAGKTRPRAMERLQTRRILEALHRDCKLVAYRRARSPSRPTGVEWGDWLQARRARALTRRR